MPRPLVWLKMTLSSKLQPDQQPDKWDDHVAVYEAVFEPLTNAFAARALDELHLRQGERLIDVAAGSGGASLMASARGADVLAVDASWQMTARTAARAAELPAAAGHVQAVMMDGTSLALPDASFDAAISVFGIILFPDADLGFREIARVLKPGGRFVTVGWTELERYELAARLIAAVTTVRGPQPPPSVLPAQLRFRHQGVLRAALERTGLVVDRVVRLEERWRLPSARWIAERISFAPGMAAMARGLGTDWAAVRESFVAALQRDQGSGEIWLSAVAHAAVAVRPS